MAAKRKNRKGWEKLKNAALALGLPEVEETTSWGEPCLKAHKKLWVWWSPHEDAPVFKMAKEEREMLIEAEPETFFCTPHYQAHNLILMHPENLDMAWVKHTLVRTWRAQSPKRFLKAYDAEHGDPDST